MVIEVEGEERDKVRLMKEIRWSCWGAEGNWLLVFILRVVSI